jgi:antitoxin (DNA-binding transcriptional repressor) of toxin-antitoxin stability system
MTTVSTRKLKDGLSAYLRRAEKGERIVVMRGRKAVAAIVPFEAAEGLDEDARLRQLAAQDLVVLPESSSSVDQFTGPRVPSRGKSASEMVLEDRR